MGDDEDRSDLWDQAWSRPEPPDEAPLRPREQWTPRASRTERGRVPGHSTRRLIEIDSHDDHMTFEPGKGAVEARPAGHRSLAPRGTVVGYRRERGPLLAIALVVLGLLLAAGIATLAWWLVTRPASSAAAPALAAMTTVGRGACSGTARLDGLSRTHGAQGSRVRA
jgi:hypothetical protein